MNSWHAVFRCSKGGYFLFLRCKSQRGRMYHRHPRFCETRSVLTTIMAFSAVAIPEHSQETQMAPSSNSSPCGRLK